MHRRHRERLGALGAVPERALAALDGDRHPGTEARRGDQRLAGPVAYADEGADGVTGGAAGAQQQGEGGHQTGHHDGTVLLMDPVWKGTLHAVVRPEERPGTWRRRA